MCVASLRAALQRFGALRKRTFEMLKIILKIVALIAICIPLGATAYVALALIGY